jgi:hypothetical protein
MRDETGEKWDERCEENRCSGRVAAYREKNFIVTSPKPPKGASFLQKHDLRFTLYRGPRVQRQTERKAPGRVGPTSHSAIFIRSLRIEHGWNRNRFQAQVNPKAKAERSSRPDIHEHYPKREIMPQTGRSAAVCSPYR